MSDIGWCNFYMVVNAIIWIFTFVYFQSKRRYFGSGSFIIFIYTIISIFAIGLFRNKDFIVERNITLFPFIYLFVMIILASYPILSIKEKEITAIEHPDNRLFNIVCTFIIFFSIIGLPATITRIQDNFMAIMLDTAMGAELYANQSAEYTTKASSQFNIIAILSGLCGGIAVIFFMYYLTLNKKNKIILWGLGVSSLVGPVGSLANGARAAIVVFALNFVGLYLFVRHFLPPKVKRKINTLFVILGMILIIPIVTITLGRNNGDSEKAVLMIQSYTSQGPILFNNYCLDPGGTRNGDYTFVVFKYILGLDPAMYYSGRLNKYFKMKIDESNFYTFVGDFTLDFGPELAIIIFLLMTLISHKLLRLKHNKMSFSQYMIFYVILKTCLGFYQYSFGTESGNLELIAILFLSLLFKIVNDINFSIKGNAITTFNSHGDL